MQLAESGTEAGARVAALRALEGIGDTRALATALRLTDDPLAAVAAAAVSLAGVFMRHGQGAAAVDGLTALALDGKRAEEIRAAAVRALKDLEPSTIAPLLKSLAGDASAVVRAEAHPSPPARLWRSRRRPVRDSKNGAPTLEPDAAPSHWRSVSPGTELSRVVDEGLPDDAQSVRQMLVGSGKSTALPVLVRLVDRIRERESAEAPNQRAAWTAARALAHRAGPPRQPRRPLRPPRIARTGERPFASRRAGGAVAYRRLLLPRADRIVLCAIDRRVVEGSPHRRVPGDR